MAYVELHDMYDLLLMTVNDLALHVIGTDNSFNWTYDNIVYAIKNRLVKPVFKLYVLYENETIKEDISDYLLTSGRYTISNQNNTRRHLSVSLLNDDGKWNLDPAGGYMWNNIKFRFDIGFEYQSTTFIKRGGVYYVVDYERDETTSGSNIVNLQMSDKWAGIDGTVSGKFESSFKAMVGSIAKENVIALLNKEKMVGVATDIKEPLFPTSLEGFRLPYTLEKTSNFSIADVIIDIATMMNCTVYYNEYGNLVFEEKADSMIRFNDSPSVWHFDNKDELVQSKNLKTNFQCPNIIKVVGATINGAIMKYTAYNTNPFSPINVNIHPYTTEIIEDENIISLELAKERANYELFFKSLLPLSVSKNCVYMPILDVNDVVSTDDFQDVLSSKKQIINEISIDINTSPSMTISTTNIAEVMPY